MQSCDTRAKRDQKDKEIKEQTQEFNKKKETFEAKLDKLQKERQELNQNHATAKQNKETAEQKLIDAVTNGEKEMGELTDFLKGELKKFKEVLKNEEARHSQETQRCEDEYTALSEKHAITIAKIEGEIVQLQEQKKDANAKLHNLKVAHDLTHISTDAAEPVEAIKPTLKYQSGYLASKPSATEFKDKVTSAVASPRAGYCSKDLQEMKYKNTRTCGGPRENIAFKLTFEFTVKEADVGEWHFDFNVDFGWGGIVFFDGKPSKEGYQSADHWWNFQQNRALPLDLAHTFTAGRHTVEVYGAEGCCDGDSEVRFTKPSGDKSLLTVDALQ